MKVGIVIGRFQPFHIGHKHLVNAALAASDRVILVVGITGTRPDTRNPLSYESVRRLIKASFTQVENDKLVIVGLEDEPYNDELWCNNLLGIAHRFVGGDETLTLFGHKKDASSYYQDLFPGMQNVDPGMGPAIDATTIRERLFRSSYFEGDWLPYPKMKLFAELEGDMARFEAEAAAVAKHKVDWMSQGTVQYGVQHVACDVLLYTDKSVLLIERGGAIGKGSLALPGGFVNAGERIIDACFRELHEETGIDMRKHKPALWSAYRCRGGIGHPIAFDYPWRSLTGRIFTHVLPLYTSDEIEPTAGDDASKAMWVPRNDIGWLKPKFYGDHYHMVKTLLSSSL